MAVSQGGLDPWAVQLCIGERDAQFAVGALLGPMPGRMMAWADGVLPSRTENGVVVDLKAALGANDGLGVAFYPGQGVSNRPGQGPYVCTLDGAGRVQFDDADPSNPRVDLIVARVYDERQGDPRTEFVLEPVTGAAGPEPVEPELPPVSFPLARIALPAGTTQLSAPMFTDIRRAASVRTGVGVVNQWDTTYAYEGDRVTVTPPAGGTTTTTIKDVRGNVTEQEVGLSEVAQCAAFERGVVKGPCR